MKFFPYENFSIVSDLDPVEAQKRIQSAIYIPGIENYVNKGIGDYDLYSTKYFKGLALNYTFELEPDVTYRNSFIPKIKGKIEKNDNGSIVSVKMALMPFALIFIAFALLFVGLAGISLTVNGIKIGNIRFYTFMSYIMLLFIYCLATFGFKYESQKSKDILSYILEGEIRE